VQDFFHPQYHTSQRPSLQVVWESLAVSLKSTIFHTGGLHCHGKITSIKMGFARLPVVVVWRLLDMTCLCNQPECSCASEDNHSNLRGCKATLQMWWRNIGKCRSVMQKKREVINYLETVWTLSLSLSAVDWFGISRGCDGKQNDSDTNSMRNIQAHLHASCSVMYLMLPRPSVEKGAPPSFACWSCLYANLLPELADEPGSLGKVMQNLLGCH
jgi:hypothetical protein